MNPQAERLAYWLWQQRGMPAGSPDEDWLLAVALLKWQTSRFDSLIRHMPLFAFGLERRPR